jgi:hypothetical protein
MKTFRSVAGSRLAIAITAVIMTTVVVAGGLSGALPGTKSVFNNDINTGAITAADLTPDALTTGPAGTNGTDGATGTAGTNGTDGAAGAAGADGADSPQGADGGVSVSASQIAMLQWYPGSKVDYATGNSPSGVAFDGTNIWITNTDSDTVSKMVTGN